MTSTETQIARQIDAWLVDHVAADVALFTAIDPGTATYTRNAACWCKADLTCVSVTQQNGDSPFKMTAITPRHVLTCSHATNSTLDTMQTEGTWIGSDGSINSRAIVASSRVPAFSGPGWDGSGTVDIKIGRLDADLPATVKPAKILRAGWQAFFHDPGVNDYGRGLPCITFNQDTTAGVDNLEYIGKENLSPGFTYSFVTALDGPTEANRSPFRIMRREGDSGSPCLMAVLGNTVLLGTWTGGTSGESVILEAAQVNRTIVALGSDGGYRLTELDLAMTGTIVPNVAEVAVLSAADTTCWEAKATAAADIQTGTGVTASADFGAGDATIRGKFGLSTIAGITAVTAVTVSGTVTWSAPGTDANPTIRTQLVSGTGLTSGTSKGATSTLLTLTSGGSGTDVPFSKTWTTFPVATSLSQAELDDLNVLFDLFNNSASTGSATATIKNLVVTVTYTVPVVAAPAARIALGTGIGI